MRELISGLVDNELSELEERRVHKAMAEDPSLRVVWERYHVIRAALRNEMDVPAGVGLPERVSAALASEPQSVVARWRPAVRTVGGLAVAASVAALTVVGIQTYRAPQSGAVVVAAKPAASTERTMRVSATRWNTKEPARERMLNGYLVEHQEASSGGVGGALPYVRIVGYDAEQPKQ
jgi:sigma-E factor negative regulatory protein RseA